MLLEALSMTREVHLAIAGDGPLRDPLEKQAHDLGVADRVRFLGWCDDIPALLAGADFLVCPSLHEPLGNVVIEAWSAGLPVIATASDGPAALIEDQVNGLLVPLPDQPGGGPAALAAAIERLCRSPELRRELGESGRRAYEAEFTEAAVVVRLSQLFRQAGAAERRAPLWMTRDCGSPLPTRRCAIGRQGAYRLRRMRVR